MILAFGLYYENWICEIVDVEAAFLNADLEGDLFIDYPEGVVEFGFETQETALNNCILLDKAIYRAVAAARQWLKKLTEILAIRMKLTQSLVNPCLFYLKKNMTLVLLVGTHFGDQQVTGTSHAIQSFKREL